MRTTNINVVRGRSYENFYTRKFIIRKFVDTKISRPTVLSKYTLPHLSLSVLSSLLCFFFSLSVIKGGGASPPPPQDETLIEFFFLCRLFTAIVTMED